MPAAAFIYGFLVALVLVAVLICALYFVLKRTREGKDSIKGYLDLIPDLTDLQRAQVQEIRRVFLPKVEEIRQNMRRKRSALAELLFDEPSDRAKIHELCEQIIGHQSELEREVIEHILEEKELLSPPQKRKFYEIITEQFSAGGLGVHDIKAGKGPSVCSKRKR